MIKRNLIAIATTATALAVGVALGTGPLNGSDHAQAEPVATKVVVDSFGQTWAKQAGPRLYAGKLSGAKVVLVVLPGASKTTVQRLRDGLEVAKADVAGTVTLTRSGLDLTQSALVDSLSSKFDSSLKLLDSDQRPFTRLGEMAGVAVSDLERGHKVSSQVSERARALISTAKLATFDSAPIADLALVVMGETGASATKETSSSALVPWLEGFSAVKAGTVIAGDSTSGASGLLHTLRSSWLPKTTVTVDGIEATYGVSAAMLGLIQQLHPSGGSYGASGVDGLLPVG